MTLSDGAVIGVDLGPGIRACFTTRAGGVSPAPWDELNLGQAVGDDPDRVAANRARVQDWAGVPLSWGHQVHGTVVRLVDGPDAGTDDCDAVAVLRPGLGAAVLVADCVPVLIADPDARVAAAVHAGRRGLLAGVVQEAVAALTAHGADPARMRAAIGPCIRGPHYEVPAAMRDEAAAVLPATACTTVDGTPGLDLPAGVRSVLTAAGLREVLDTGLDTAVDDRFFSHRRAQRAGVTTGRSAGVIALV
ncbi:peptidoglycan editing factor PgeF [Cellulomonas denverensis]|uniref:peptidoglycan editing factor PgeF n=1 Tax=Cellulomonas denverensis TaxID=264297 RepID=UPI001A5BB79C|nr:peptidoglycan editing factor PgeF [Cellulomonas denverensis]GIG25142.1 laccase domain protein [Cellulomonas denverensis]